MNNGTGRRGPSQTLKAQLGLRDLILSGMFGPGDRLSEPVVARRLGLSRTPIRAALARLEQEGLIEAIPSGGYAVTSFTVSDVTDAIEIRGVLEGTAARLAAERGLTRAQSARFHALLAELDDVVGKPAEEFDYEAYIDKNARFHEMLHDAAGSRILSREIERIISLSFASPSAFLKVQIDTPEFLGTLIVAQSQHKAIVQAIEFREGARAEALSREHARLARQNLDVVLNDADKVELMPALSLVSG